MYNYVFVYHIEKKVQALFQYHVFSVQSQYVFVQSAMNLKCLPTATS